MRSRRNAIEILERLGINHHDDQRIAKADLNLGAMCAKFTPCSPSRNRKFRERIVFGLTGVHACALADPPCSLETARFNASHLRAKPNIQGKIARLHAQADANAGPAVLTMIEKRRCLAPVVRANLICAMPKLMVICWSASTSMRDAKSLSRGRYAFPIRS